jgi:hypothetical protein
MRSEREVSRCIVQALQALVMTFILDLTCSCVDSHVGIETDLGCRGYSYSRLFRSSQIERKRSAFGHHRS